MGAANGKEKELILNQCVFTVQGKYEECWKYLGCGGIHDDRSKQVGSRQKQNRKIQDFSILEYARDLCPKAPAIAKSRDIRQLQTPKHHEEYMKTLIAAVSDNKAGTLKQNSVPKNKSRRDSRPHRFSIYKSFDPNWTEIDDCKLESAVAEVSDMQGLGPHWVDRRSMKNGQFVSVKEGYFWQRVSGRVANKCAAECFQRYAAIQASAVAKFTTT